jgi:arylsulfatase B
MRSFALSILVLLSAALGGHAAATRQPNILLIVADDLGYGELGCQGNPQIPTPNIDSIAQAGIRCTSGYVTASLCSPSRAALLTGRYQTRYGHEFNPVGAENLDPEIGLPLTEKTIANRLHDAGYATGIVGKWHLGATPPYHPQRRGFDEFFGFLHEAHFYTAPPYRGVYSRFRNDEPAYDAHNPLLRDTSEVETSGYLTDDFNREALAFIDRHQDRPWFLYLPYNAVHSPMQAKLADVERFAALPSAQRQIFAGMLFALDRSVGEVLAKIRALGQEENTLVIFLSDNGGPTQELTSSNLPLRGGKGSLYEGGIRIPFLVQWKGHLPTGRTYDPPVSSLDLAPTILAAANVPPEDASLEGANLLPFLSGTKDSAPHDFLFWRMGQLRAMRAGPWKLVQRRPAAPQLFNLSSDLAEEHDLSATQPATLARLESAYAVWDHANVPAHWSPPGKPK